MPTPCRGARTLNLLLGTVVIGMTVLIHTFGLIAITKVMSRLTAQLRMHGGSRPVAMITVVLGLFVVITSEVWLWAASYMMLGVFVDFSDRALYFSTTTFATIGTIGLGDVVPNAANPGVSPTSRQWCGLAVAPRMAMKLTFTHFL